MIFLSIKPTQVLGIVPKAKRYLYFPIDAKKIAKLGDIFQENDENSKIS